MKIVFSSITNEFEPITLYDYKQFYNDIGKFPITEVRQEYLGRRVFILKKVENMFALPVRENKDYEITFGDGLVHHNARYKPQDITIGIWFDSEEFMRIFDDLYFTRGLFTMTIETDWGTTNTCNVRLSVSNGNRTELTLQNTSTKVTTTQNSEYSFTQQVDKFGLYPSLLLYPNSNVFPNSYYNPSDNSLNTVSTLDPKKGSWTFTLKTNADVVLVKNIMINEKTWTVPPQSMVNGNTLVFDITNNKIILNGVDIPGMTLANIGKIYKVSTVYISTEHHSDSAGIRIETEFILNVVSDTIAQVIQ